MSIVVNMSAWSIRDSVLGVSILVFEGQTVSILRDQITSFSVQQSYPCAKQDKKVAVLCFMRDALALMQGWIKFSLLEIMIMVILRATTKGHCLTDCAELSIGQQGLCVRDSQRLATGAALDGVLLENNTNLRPPPRKRLASFLKKAWCTSLKFFVVGQFR